jgi:hypothetical protein
LGRQRRSERRLGRDPAPDRGGALAVDPIAASAIVVLGAD